MQQLRAKTDRRVTPDLCARRLLGGVPAIMRFIHHQMRQNRRAELTVPQFRALVFVKLSEDTSLSAMAAHLGVSPPAASRMVEVLVKRRLIERRAQPGDRRRISLSLTGRGRRVLRFTFDATRKAMARSFSSLSQPELAKIVSAMQILGRVFAPKDYPQGPPP